jgi:Ice-binding-like
MNRFENITKPLRWFMALLLTAFVAGCGGGDGIPGAGSAGPGAVCTGAGCVDLGTAGNGTAGNGTAGNYAILAKAGISTTGTTKVTGSLGVSPIKAIGLTGFGQKMDASNVFSTSSLVTGKIYAADYASPTPSDLGTAVLNMQSAYTNAGLMQPAGGGLTTACPGGAAGMSDATDGAAFATGLTPGVYTCTIPMTIPGTLTLNGAGVYVFRFAQTLDQVAATQVILTGGALPQNVFWVVTGAVTIGPKAGGVSTKMQGVILAAKNIAVQTGATVNGRLLAQTDVALDTSTITQP